MAEGYLADLLIMDGDPTEDIALLQAPERRRAVLRGGLFAYLNPPSIRDSIDQTDTFRDENVWVSPGQFAPRWPDAMEASASAPVDAKPLRIAVSTSLRDVISDPVHDGIGIEWFADTEHLGRFERWLAGAGGEPVSASLDAAIDVGSSPVVVTRPLVLRGGDWLENRWRSGGALARAHGDRPTSGGAFAGRVLAAVEEAGPEA